MTDTALQDYAIWVLLPSLETDDPNLQYYYDFEPALAVAHVLFSNSAVSGNGVPLHYLQLLRS